MKKYIAILLLVMGFVFATKAQDSLKYKLADFYHDSAQSAFTLESYDTACKYTRLHLDLELSFENPRRIPVLESYITAAFCEFKDGRYKNAIVVYNKALGWMDKAGSPAFANSFFDFIDLCYEMMESQEKVFFEYDVKDYRKTFVFQIEEVLERKGNIFKVKIGVGQNDGIVKGAIAHPISASPAKGEPPRKFQLGTGEIIEVNAWSSIAEIEIYNEQDTVNWVKAGDVVETRVLSKFKEESTLYKLLASNVVFRDNNREMFINPRYILHYDNKMFQELMLMLMEQQVAETEEFTREGDMFLNPATEGQNQGKSIHDLFLEPDTGDIHDFLRFVHSFPRKYMGKAYKVNETYATWLLNNSPSTPNIILDSLLAENNSARLLEILAFNKPDLTDDFYKTWAERADEFADKQLFEQANRTTYFIRLAGSFLNNNNIKAYGYFQSGKIKKQQSVYGAAISFYDSAARIYLQLGNSLEYARSVYKKGSVFGDWAKYKEAIENYELAEAQLKKKIGNSNNYSENELLAFILWDKGYTKSKRGDNEGAVSAYDEAEKILNKIGGSKTNRATLNRNIALVVKNKGQYSEALEKFKAARTLFFQAGNAQKYAEAFDDIADTYFKMGQYRDAINYYSDAYDIKLAVDDKSGAGFSKSNVGQAYWNLGLYDSAILAHREAVQLRKEGNDPKGMAYSYEKIALLWNENGNVDSALQSYQKAENLYITNNDTTDKLAGIKESIGEVYYNVKNYDKAIKYYRHAGDMYKQIGNNIGVANNLYNIALCYYEIKSYNNANEYLLQAQKQYEEMQDIENVMYCYIYLSLVQRTGNNNFGEAEKLMGKALVLAKESNSLTNQGYAFREIGYLKQNQGKFTQAKQYFDSSFAVYQQSGDYVGLGYTRLALGYYYIEKGEFAKSQKMYWQVVNEATDKKNYLLAAAAFGNLTDYYNLVGEYDSAKYVSNRSAELNENLRNEYIEAGNYISLGNTYNYLADNKKAVEYYYKSDSVYRSVKDPLSRVVPINNIGTIYFFQGDYRNALLQFNEVYEQLKKINYEGEMMQTALLNMGEVYLEDGVLNAADNWLTQGLESSLKVGNIRGETSAQLLLGKLKLKQKKYDEAQKHLRAGFNGYTQIGEKERIIEASTYMGKLYYQTNKTDSAKKYLSHAVQVAQQTGNTRYQWEPLYISSTISLQQKDTAKAVAQLKEAIDLLENIKGKIAGSKKNLASFAKAQDKYKLYQDLVTLLVAQNDVKAAFYYQEKANIAGLLEQTRGGDNGPTRSNALLGGLQEETEAKELELKIDGYYAELIKERSKPQTQQSAEKIKTLEELIDVNETNFGNFLDSAMTAEGSDAVNFSTTINPRQLDDARFSLSDEDAVIEYLLTDDQLLIFVATNNSLNARRVSVNKEHLDNVINEFYKQLSTSKSDEKIVVKNSQNLYTIFIAPISDLIENHTRLAFVPTGVLYKLPLQALGKEVNEKMEYLISKHDVTYINNIKFVYQAQAGGMPELKIVAFGNADNTLSNAEKEVKEIEALSPENTTIFLRDSATEDKAKTMIGNFNVVHFAIHGRLDPVKHENSYLALAPNSSAGDDGRLTMSEIRKFRNLRNIRLLVLSACNTAVKEEKVEGWVNTPANEFILKGVGSVIATQWQVHDEATGVLMKHFYTNLLAGMTFSEALKTSQLQLSTSEKFSHPYYWSAFETIGKW